MARSLTIQIPDELEDCREDLRRFFDSMVYKLKVNAHKGKWEKFTVEERLTRIVEETEELREAVKDGNTVEIVLESADVANFAMMAAAIAITDGNDRK